MRRATIFLFTVLTLQVATAQTPSRVSPALPVDVKIPPNFPSTENPIEFFDDYSWRTFIALNWPAESDKRGVADPNKDFGESAERVVWQTWKADHETFLDNGVKPKLWEEADAGLMIKHYNQAGMRGEARGSLSDANGKYVRYEVRLNKVEFEDIRTRELYLRKNLPKQGAPTLTFPIGSIELKAAWKEFTPTELTNDAMMRRFYTSKMEIVDPDGSARTATLGLIGFHIVHRTPTRREWIWSTFEHIDNVSGSQSVLHGVPSPAPANRLLPKVDSANPPQANPTPVPVRRLKGVHPSTQETNQLYRNLKGVKGTVWENYELIATQWPTTPAATEQEFIKNFEGSYPAGAGRPFPGDRSSRSSIANLTMETTASFQRGTSCMKCHFRAGKQAGTEFVWTVPLQAWPPQ